MIIKNGDVVQIMVVAAFTSRRSGDRLLNSHDPSDCAPPERLFPDCTATCASEWKRCYKSLRYFTQRKISSNWLFTSISLITWLRHKQHHEMFMKIAFFCFSAVPHFRSKHSQLSYLRLMSHFVLLLMLETICCNMYNFYYSSFYFPTAEWQKWYAFKVCACGIIF